MPVVGSRNDFHAFAMPSTPEFSPAASKHPLASEAFAIDQTEAEPEPESENVPRTIVMCFDGTTKKFGAVCLVHYLIH